MWKNQPFDKLTSPELEEALDFFQRVYDEISGSAPPAVWSYFADQLTKITMVKMNRLMSAGS